MSLTKLIQIAGGPIGPDVTMKQVIAAVAGRWGACGEELAELLRLRNGFYAFESSLLVRGIGSPPAPRDLVEWNSVETWVGLYDDLDGDEMLFFAEDVFGNQFAMQPERVVLFDSETGDSAEFAGSLGEWADAVLTDYAYCTGHPVAHEWQARNGVLQPGMKLMPEVPFVCGGEFDAGKLFSIEEREAMAFKADLANQISELPDGAQIEFRVE